jgi:hypothetical protein
VQINDAPTALARWLSLPARNVLEMEVAEQALASVERRYGLTIPSDLRSFLALLDTAQEYEWDDEDVLWWGIARLKTIPDEYSQPIRNPEISREPDSYLFFADYSIWCWAWAICCGDGENRGRVAVISAGDAFVADSFSDFVTRYLADPMSIMP